MRKSGIHTLAVYGLLFMCTIFGLGILGIASQGHGEWGFTITLGSMAGLPVFGVISMFETRTMLAAMEKMVFPRTFLLSRFFKNTHTSNTESVDIDIIKGRRRLAPFVSPVNQGKVVSRSGFVTRTFKVPYIKPKMAFSGADLLKRQPGETIYAGNKTPAAKAQEALGKDLIELDQMITRREEWMAAQGLFTGKVRCIGDGMDVEIDFLRDTDLFVTLEDLFWADDDGVPITNLKAWKKLVSLKSGTVPDTMVCGERVIMPFIKNAEVQKLVDKTKIVMAQINPQELPEGVTYYGTVEGLDIFTYDEYYEDDNGVLQPMVPVNQVLIGSSRARNSREYGAIQDLKAAAAVARFPKSWEEEDPSVRWVMMQSAPLPAILDTDAFLTATVVEEEEEA